MVEAKGCIVLDVSKEEGGGRREYIGGGFKKVEAGGGVDRGRIGV